MLQKGDLIGGEYKVYKICEGGMGVVYICQHTSNQGVYALKTFKDNEYSLASYAQDLFEKEAIIWVKMGWFPYIVKAVAVERLDKRVYVILEYINPDLNGRNTLADYIGNQTEKEIIDISLQVCYGMEYAFTKGLQAHRDLKPNNIMMTSDGTVKITDFGLARMYQAVYERKQRYPKKVDDKVCLFFKSSAGHACGTPPYMAPEQFGGDADQRSDIYSFGIILYEMTGNGYPPFVSRNIEDYERLHKYDKINSLSTPLFPIIQKCLEKNPAQRYQTFSEVKRELESYYYNKYGKRFIPVDANEAPYYVELAHKANALDSLGQHREALVLYEKVLEINPDYAVAWFNKGIALEKMNESEKALVCIDKALEFALNEPFIWNNKGLVLLKMNRFSEAINCFDKALQLNSKYIYAYDNKGSALEKSGKENEALICWDKALKLYPRNVMAWYNKGVILSKRGAYREALVCFDKALEINPKFIEAWRGKGLLHQNTNQNSEAIKCYDKILQISPNDATDWNQKSLALFNSGKHADALNCIEKSLSIDQNCAEAYYVKGLALQQLGKTTEALESLNKATTINPNFEAAWYAAGGLFSDKNEIDNALNCLDKVTKINPNNADAWGVKGIMLYGVIETIPNNKLSQISKEGIEKFRIIKQEALSCVEKALSIETDKNKIKILRTLLDEINSDKRL